MKLRSPAIYSTRAAHTGVPSDFAINGNDIQFNISPAYNHQQTLTIDPWITALTTMTPTNMGFDVDYDYSGNTLVYGAGPTDLYDVTDFFEITEYNSAGIAVWTFKWFSFRLLAGTLQSGGSFNYVGGFMVDKLNAINPT